MYIPVELLKNTEAGCPIRSEYVAARRQEINTKTAEELDGADRASQRRAMLGAVAAESLELAFERYIGDIDLLPINYLQIGATRSRAVGRLRYFDTRVGRNATATGFLISPNLVLTNHHVFSEKTSFKNALIDFDYAYGVDGHELDKITFRLDPDKFFYANKDLDCALIGIADRDESNAHRITERGYLVLNPGVGKIGNGDSATIIQHPDGNYQEIALRKNQILDIKPNALIYASDTSPGSSGAPVFNDEWQVIALHSAGVAKKNDAGEYLDQQGKVIPVINGHIDASQVVWIANTGIRVSSLVADWLGQPELKGNKYLQFLGDSAYTDARSRAGAPTVLDQISNVETALNSKPNDMKSIEINSGPGQPGVTININVNFGAGSAPGPTIRSVTSTVAGEESFESKLEDEKNRDYSKYTGFDDHFMGVPTPLPKLGAQLARKAATLLHGPKQIVLKYQHYSTIVHSLRRMPIVSAINVAGDPTLRKDKADRVDRWMRDNRIDLNVQLSDDFYAKSGFDIGHMSRREDADWGVDADAAKEAADLTCMYSNACPQVPNLNRAVFGYHGVWGELEKIVLENGARKEAGESSKICVYNGPIFVDTDPTFKGVQIPMRFFKVIVWRNGANEMKSTAFVLSQEDLVGGIQFEELQFDKEFVEHQCSIAYLEKLTDLTFTGISQWDTSPRKGDATAVTSIDRAGIKKHVAGHAAKPTRRVR